MAFERKKVASALALVLGSGVIVAAAPAAAQDIRVEVVGSNIKRVEGEGALPVEVLSRRDLDTQGVTTTAQLLDKISANQSFGAVTNATGVGSSYQGLTAASLRGLGANRTLVLLNGRRIAAYATSDGYGVDLNQIPISAIERVEILKDGASAIYGTDAIAGVINFVLRRDYTGAEVYGYYADTQQGGGREYQATVSGGWGDLTKDKFNVFGMFSYFNNDALAASDRDFARTAYRPDLGIDKTSGQTFPASINIPGVTGTRNPGLAAGCKPPFSFPTTGSPTQCRFDYASVIDIYPPSERFNVLGSFIWQFLPQHQFYSEAGYYKATFDYAISPTPVSSAVQADARITLQPSSPFYPRNYVISQGGDPTSNLNVFWRALELGPRAEEVEGDSIFARAGVRGAAWKGWDYDAAFNWSRNSQTNSYTSGYLNADVIMPILNSGRVNFFDFNTPAVLTEMQQGLVLGKVQENTANQYGVDGKVSGDLWSLPSGMMTAALGAEWRKEDLTQDKAEIYTSGAIIGGAGAIPSLPKVDRDVWAVYGEVNIPIVKTLEGNIAVRYDDYSDFGGTTNPKVSLRWQPLRELLVRGSWGTGFRAPTLYDLYSAPLRTNSAGSYDDPERCPVTQSTEDCNLQFNTLRSGNVNLVPEESKQWTVGVVWEPVNNITLGVDYFYVKIDDVITFIDADTVMSDYDRLGPIAIVRGPKPPGDPAGIPGPISYIIEANQNLTEQIVSGLDLSANARFASDYGNFNFSFSGTYLFDYKQTDVFGDGPFEYVGQRGPGTGAISRWRHNLALDWSRGPWGSTLANTFQGPYEEPCASLCDTRTVNAYSLWDWQLRYTGFKNTTLVLGVKNLLNTDPPTSEVTSGFIVGYDSSYGNPQGRMFYGSVRYAFK